METKEELLDHIVKLKKSIYSITQALESIKLSKIAREYMHENRDHFEELLIKFEEKLEKLDIKCEHKSNIVCRRCIK